MMYLFALVSCVLFGVGEFLYKVAHQEPLHEATYLVVQSGTVLCALGLISAGGAGWELTPQTMLLGVGCGLMGFGTAVFLLVAMGRGPASVTAAVRNLSFLVTALLAITFLGEDLTAAKGAGLALAAVGLLVIAWTPHADHRPAPIIYFTVLFAGVLAFGHKLGAIAGVSPSAFLMCQAATVHLCAHVWCHATGGYKLGSKGVRLAPVTGALVATGMVLLIYALRRGEASVLVPLTQLSFLITAPLSFWLLREAVTPRKLLGLTLGAAALLVFSMIG